MNVLITPKKPAKQTLYVKKIVITEKSASQSDYLEVLFYDEKNKVIAEDSCDRLGDLPQLLQNMGVTVWRE